MPHVTAGTETLGPSNGTRGHSGDNGASCGISSGHLDTYTGCTALLENAWYKRPGLVQSLK